MTNDVKPWVRVTILIVAIVVSAALSYLLTGSVPPSAPGDALIFQNALLLVVLGSTLLEHRFTKPADSVVNSLVGAITLMSVSGAVPNRAWWAVFGYCAFVFVIATTCTATSSSRHTTGWQRRAADITYRPAVLLGSARLLYSVLFLFGLFSFYEMGSRQTLTLVLFWGLFVVIWPLGIPELLNSLGGRSKAQLPIGRVVRLDSPNLLRFAVQPTASWSPAGPKVYHQADGSQHWILPLYAQAQEEEKLGTGLCILPTKDKIDGLEAGYAYEPPAGVVAPTASEIAQSLGGQTSSRLVGFVVEDSSIGEIKFELWDPLACQEGMLVWCPVSEKIVFFQVANGVTREESLESNRHGFQIAHAVQLGVLDQQAGFQKYPWLPAMNTPVFAEPAEFGADSIAVGDDDFTYGVIPNSQIPVTGPFEDACDFHTAILGITGSGKTELAFDLIRNAIKRGRKVVCVDLTAQYRERLADMSVDDLSISETLAGELGKKLFDAETGQYGAGAEKKALDEFATKLRTEISASIERFLTAKESPPMLGIIELNEISNTKATLYVTELYLTCLLQFAKQHRDDCPPILIVVEEAHTVMPEPSTMGLGDFDSRGLVGKIAQIALQGRKYGVGLLVLAQRTATVSKSVLTQCNTIVSFTCFDDTSLGFLKNIFGPAHIDLIPNLAPLQAVIFGKGLRSQRPIVAQIPFDPVKAALGDRRRGSLDS